MRRIGARPGFLLGPFLMLIAGHALQAQLVVRGSHFTDQASYWPFIDETNRPAACHDNGRTYIAFSMAAPNDDDFAIVSYDHRAGTFSDVVKIGDTELPDKDNHGGPVVTVADNGRIHVIAGGHGRVGKMKHFVSTRPEDISSWEEVHDIDPFATYPSLFKMSDGTIYYIFRHGNHREDWTFQASADDGVTWEPPQSILASGHESGTSHVDGLYGVSGHPYFDSWYGYWLKGSGDTIHVVYNYHACTCYERVGVGKRQQYNLYYMKYDHHTGKWSNREGNDISHLLPLRFADANTHTLVWKSAVTTGQEPDTTQRFTQMNLSVDRHDNPYILFIHGTPDDDQRDNAVLVKPTNTGWFLRNLPNDDYRGTLIVHSETDIEIAYTDWRRTTDGGKTWSIERYLRNQANDSRFETTRCHSGRVENAHQDAQWLFVEGQDTRDDDHAKLFLYGNGGFLSRPTGSTPSHSR